MTIERLSSIVEIAIMLGLSPCFTSRWQGFYTCTFHKIGDDEVVETDNECQQKTRNDPRHHQG